jgi:hypothetical protein
MKRRIRNSPLMVSLGVNRLNIGDSSVSSWAVVVVSIEASQVMNIVKGRSISLRLHPDLLEKLTAFRHHSNWASPTGRRQLGAIDRTIRTIRTIRTPGATGVASEARQGVASKAGQTPEVYRRPVPRYTVPTEQAVLPQPICIPVCCAQQD